MNNSMIDTDYEENQVGDSISLAETVVPKFIDFGRQLKAKRQENEFTLIDAVKHSINYGNYISKSLFSMYENGNMRDIDGRNMETLSKVYGISYHKLVNSFCSQKYHLDTNCGANVSNAMSNILGGVKLLSLEKLRHQQEGLANNASVVVSADDFLDDDIFYEMVRNNINRGIKYTYHIPMRAKPEIEAFRERLLFDDVLDGDVKKIEDSTRMLVQGEKEYSFNFVVHICSGAISAFKGIVIGKRPTAYYQVSSIDGEKLLGHIEYSLSSEGQTETTVRQFRRGLTVV